MNKNHNHLKKKLQKKANFLQELFSKNFFDNLFVKTFLTTNFLKRTI